MRYAAVDETSATRIASRGASLGPNVRHGCSPGSDRSGRWLSTSSISSVAGVLTATSGGCVQPGSDDLLLTTASAPIASGRAASQGEWPMFAGILPQRRGSHRREIPADTRRPTPRPPCFLKAPRFAPSSSADATPVEPGQYDSLEHSVSAVNRRRAYISVLLLASEFVVDRLIRDARAQLYGEDEAAADRVCDAVCDADAKIAPKRRPARRPARGQNLRISRQNRRWRDPDSNRGHHDFQSCALPTELSRRGPRSYRVGVSPHSPADPQLAPSFSQASR
jgi:hypothetical protein